MSFDCLGIDVLCSIPSDELTCILTIWPSPLDPSTMAVTTTKVSFATKFRIHRWYLVWLPVWAARSNLSASDVDIRTNHRKRAARNGGNMGDFIEAVEEALVQSK